MYRRCIFGCIPICTGRIWSTVNVDVNHGQGGAGCKGQGCRDKRNWIFVQLDNADPLTVRVAATNVTARASTASGTGRFTYQATRRICRIISHISQILCSKSQPAHANSLVPRYVGWSSIAVAPHSHHRFTINYLILHSFSTDAVHQRAHPLQVKFSI